MKLSPSVNTLRKRPNIYTDARITPRMYTPQYLLQMPETPQYYELASTIIPPRDMHNLPGSLGISSPDFAQ